MGLLEHSDTILNWLNWTSSLNFDPADSEEWDWEGPDRNAEEFCEPVMSKCCMLAGTVDWWKSLALEVVKGIFAKFQISVGEACQHSQSDSSAEEIYLSPPYTVSSSQSHTTQ